MTTPIIVLVIGEKMAVCVHKRNFVVHNMDVIVRNMVVRVRKAKRRTLLISENAEIVRLITFVLISVSSCYGNRKSFTRI